MSVDVTFASLAATALDPDQSLEAPPNSEDDLCPLKTVENLSDLVEIGCLYASSLDDPNLKFDWALIQITTKDLELSQSLNVRTNLPSSSHPRESEEIVAFIGSRGPVTGTSCSSSTFLKMKDSNFFQETWTVQLRDKLGLDNSHL